MKSRRTLQRELQLRATARDILRECVGDAYIYDREIDRLMPILLTLVEAAQTAARDALMEVVAAIPCLHGHDTPHRDSAEILRCVLDAVRIAARREQSEEDVMIASEWSLRPDRSLHPDMPWNQMNETAQMVAHSAAQQIAAAIRAALLPWAP